MMDSDPTNRTTFRSPAMWGLLTTVAVLGLGSSLWLAMPSHHDVWKTLRPLFDWKVKATFSANNMAKALQEMCAKEYQLRIETRQSDDNLQAFFWKVGLMRNGQAELKMEAAETLERVFLCATRIALSTDAPLRFVQVKMVDVLTGSSVSLWRYVPDIRDSMYNRIAEDEYFNRLVMEVEGDSQDRFQEWRPMRWDPPMTMSQFLAKQVIMRVKRQYAAMQAHADITTPDTLKIVVDNWSVLEQQSEQDISEMEAAIQLSAHIVIENYRFKEFHNVVLQDNQGVLLKRWTL